MEKLFKKIVKTSGAIIKKDGKFLLLKRANTKIFNNYWSLPGGKIEKNENPKEAIKREVKEETNLNFKPFLFKICNEDFSYSHFNWKAKAHFFHGEFKGNTKINKESSEFGWFSLEKIKGMTLAFNHKKIIEDFIKLKCL